jgi:hypothetical protein
VPSSASIHAECAVSSGAMKRQVVSETGCARSTESATAAHAAQTIHTESADAPPPSSAPGTTASANHAARTAFVTHASYELRFPRVARD